jgi:hypothetical protein
MGRFVGVRGVWDVLSKGDGGVCELTWLHRHDDAGMCKCALGRRGSYRSPSPWALLDVRVVTLGSITIVPVERRRQDWGLG